MRDINSHIENGKVKHNAVIWEDKLIVDGRPYTVDTLDKLPPDISTEKLATPCRNNMVAFFSKYSPFSNYFKN